MYEGDTFSVTMPNGDIVEAVVLDTVADFDVEGIQYLCYGQNKLLICYCGLYDLKSKVKLSRVICDSCVIPESSIPKCNTPEFDFYAEHHDDSGDDLNEPDFSDYYEEIDEDELVDIDSFFDHEDYVNEHFGDREKARYKQLLEECSYESDDCTHYPEIDADEYAKMLKEQEVTLEELNVLLDKFLD